MGGRMGRMGGGMGVSTLHLQIRVVDSQCVYSRLQTRALLTRADTLRLLACSPQALPRKELCVGGGSSPPPRRSRHRSTLYFWSL